MSDFGYYLVEAFIRHKSSVWVGVVGSGCGFTCILYIVLNACIKEQKTYLLLNWWMSSPIIVE